MLLICFIVNRSPRKGLQVASCTAFASAIMSDLKKPRSPDYFTAWDLRQPGPSLAVVNLGTKAFCMDVGVDKVIVGGADRCVHVFDTRRLGTLLEKRESSLKHQIRSVKVGIDQKFFASSSVEGRVAIEYFDPEENLSSRYAFKCHRVREAGCEEKVHPVNAIDFHPVHGTFATGGSDGGVCVWDGYAKKRVWKLNPFHTS
ncbi:unnamed protein product, partial [Polarella glacialis]